MTTMKKAAVELPEHVVAEQIPSLVSSEWQPDAFELGSVTWVEMNLFGTWVSSSDSQSFAALSNEALTSQKDSPLLLAYQQGTHQAH
jgi:hypothetical protein